jgi:hypothetical protein
MDEHTLTAPSDIPEMHAMPAAAKVALLTTRHGSKWDIRTASITQVDK